MRCQLSKADPACQDFGISGMHLSQHYDCSNEPQHHIFPCPLSVPAELNKHTVLGCQGLHIVMGVAQGPPDIS